MIKSDELALWKELWKRKNNGEDHPMIYQIAEELGIPFKRMDYIAEKWHGKRLIDCGVSARTGWIIEGVTEADLK